MAIILKILYFKNSELFLLKNSIESGSLNGPITVGKMDRTNPIAGCALLFQNT